MKSRGVELTRQYAALASSERATLREGLLNMREQRVRVVRANPRAIQKDADNSFKILKNEVCFTLHDAWTAYSPLPLKDDRALPPHIHAGLLLHCPR